MRAGGTPITKEQNQFWFNNGNIPVAEVHQRLLAQTSNSGQDLASINNHGTELIEMTSTISVFTKQPSSKYRIWLKYSQSTS